MSSAYLARMTPIRKSIIDNLGEWRALELKDIKERISYIKSDQGLRKILRGLKDVNYIKSSKIGINGKVFYYINKSLHESVLDSVSPVQEEFLFHDILTSKFLMSFVKNYKVESHKLCPAVDDDLILNPDAELMVRVGKELQCIAIEMELTRKSIKRYIYKFNSYSHSNKYGLVLYVFNDEGIFNSYKSRLNEEFKNLKNCKIVLILNSTLNLTGIDLNQSLVYAFGEDLKLKDLFVPSGEIAC